MIEFILGALTFAFVSMFVIVLCAQDEKNAEAQNFKTITITVREHQTLWDIASEFYRSNPYGYTRFSEYYGRLLRENAGLQNRDRSLRAGDKIQLKLKRV